LAQGPNGQRPTGTKLASGGQHVGELCGQISRRGIRTLGTWPPPELVNI